MLRELWATNCGLQTSRRRANRAALFRAIKISRINFQSDWHNGYPRGEFANLGSVRGLDLKKLRFSGH